MRIYLPFIFFFLFLLIPTPLLAEEWQIDINHSAAHFSVQHMLIARVRGNFSNLTGSATFDPQSGKMTDLQIKIGVASIDTGVVKRDEHLRSNDFFAADKYPTITFVAREINEGPDGTGRITGLLTIRGISREVSVVLDGPSPAIKDPWGNLRKGARISTTINRKDFGITYNNILENNGLLIGDLVEIETDLEFLTPKPAG